MEAPPKDDSLRHCVRKYLVKAAAKLLKQGGVPDKEVITALAQVAPITKTWESTRCMSASGWPFIGFDPIEETTEGASTSHAVVITGGVVSHDGAALGVYVRDPLSLIDEYRGRDGKSMDQQIVVARRFTQKQICADPPRLLNAWGWPAAHRQLHPPAAP